MAAALIASGALALAAAAPAAAANHIPGATYNGTESAGGSAMSFTVTADGAGISSFSIVGPLPGSICTFSGIQSTYLVPLPIVNDTFTDTSPPLTFTGSFPGVQSAQGTLRMNSGGCDTGNVAWTATTTATPPSATTPTTPAKKKCKKGQRKVKVNGKIK